MAISGMEYNRLRQVLEAAHGLSLGYGRLFYVRPTTQPSFHSELTQVKPDGFVRNSVEQGYNGCTDDRGDVVLLLPGTHTLSAELAVTKGFITFCGLPGYEKETIVEGSAVVGQEGFVVTGSNVVFRNLSIRCNGGATKSGLVSAGNTGVYDCIFDGDGSNGIRATGDGLTVKGCKFRGLEDAITKICARC